MNDGTFTYSRSYSLVTDSDGNIVIDNSPQTIAAFEPNTAYTMTYMMQNAVENGTGREAQIWNMPVAGKTGTSGEYKDRWFCGCTPYYVAAVWTGFDQPARIGVSGNPAAQLFRKIMQPIHEGLDWRNFTSPSIGGNTGIFGLEDGAADDKDAYEGDGIIIVERRQHDKRRRYKRRRFLRVETAAAAMRVTASLSTAGTAVPPAAIPVIPAAPMAAASSFSAKKRGKSGADSPLSPLNPGFRAHLAAFFC